MKIKYHQSDNSPPQLRSEDECTRNTGDNNQQFVVSELNGVQLHGSRLKIGESKATYFAPFAVYQLYFPPF